ASLSNTNTREDKPGAAHSSRGSMPVCGIPCSLSLKQQSPEVFGSSRLLHQKPYVLLRACLAFNSLYWLIRSMSVFGNAHWLLYLTHWTF
ncbi:unnamed protein product, partial [Ectocarpus sp. 13 AM-2016]